MADSSFLDVLNHPLATLAGILLPIAALITKHGYDKAKAQHTTDLVAKLDEKVDILERNHQEFKLEVAQRYSTTESIHQMEVRLLTAISATGTQLERLSDRIERLFTPVVIDK